MSRPTRIAKPPPIPPPRPREPAPPPRAELPDAGEKSVADPLLEELLPAWDAVLPALAPEDPRQSRDDGNAESEGEETGNGENESQPAPPEATPQLQALREIGQTVARACHLGQNQGAWSLRLPLDPELLPDTVLQLSYSLDLLSLHFETRDWDVREMLRPRVGELEKLVERLVPLGCEVVVSV